MPTVLSITKKNWRTDLEKFEKTEELPHWAKQILISFFSAFFENLELEPFMQDSLWHDFLGAVNEKIFIDKVEYRFIRAKMRLSLEPIVSQPRRH